MAKLMRFLMLLAVVGLVAVPAMAGVYWEGSDDPANPGDWQGLPSEWVTIGGARDYWIGAQYTQTGDGQLVGHVYLEGDETDHTSWELHIGSASNNTDQTGTRVGSLDIRNNGDVYFDRIIVGRHTNLGLTPPLVCTGTLTIRNGGKAKAVDDIYIGSAGTGTLNVDAGGIVEGGDEFVVGNLAGGVGTVIINGSVTCTNKVYLGREGTGTLTINSGGSLTVTDSGTYDGISVGTFAGGNGTLIQNGGTVDTGGYLRIGHGAGSSGGTCSGKYELKGGTLHVRSATGIAVGYDNGSNPAGSSLEVSGGTISTTYQNADTGLRVAFGCKFKVIGDDATIGFKGDLTASSTSTLSYDVDSGGVSRIQVGIDGTGDVTLGGGTLEFSVSEALGSLAFITLIDNQGASAVSGTFNGLAEGDGVTLGDFGGVTYTGKIGYAGDYATSASSGGNDVVIYDIVPEPATMTLLLIGLPFALRRRRQKRA